MHEYAKVYHHKFNKPSNILTSSFTHQVLFPYVNLFVKITYVGYICQLICNVLKVQFLVIFKTMSNFRVLHSHSPLRPLVCMFLQQLSQHKLGCTRMSLNINHYKKQRHPFQACQKLNFYFRCLGGGCTDDFKISNFISQLITMFAHDSQFSKQTFISTL